MPDAKKPKAPSGAAKRKARAERERLAADGDGAADFAELGPPPVDDPDTALAWVRKAQLVAMYLASSRPLSNALLARLKLVDKLASAIGFTQNRAALEEVAERVEALIADVKPHGAVKTIQAAGVAPATLGRGGSATRGPRAVPGPTARPAGVHRDRRSPQGADGTTDPDGGGEVG